MRQSRLSYFTGLLQGSRVLEHKFCSIWFVCIEVTWSVWNQNIFQDKTSLIKDILGHLKLLFWN
jgi:hypothetical protein